MTDQDQQSTEDFWQRRATQAEERRLKLASFGPYVRGLYIETPVGHYVVDPEDGFVSDSLLREGVSGDGEFQILQSIVNANSDVLVVGAHIGTHTIRLSKICRAVIAIEASPKNYGFLQANLRLNQCANVTTHAVAASDKVEKIKFLLSRDNSGGSKRMPQTPHIAYVYDQPEVVEVDAAPLDALITARPFDLVLMDVEGSECFALRGMPNILSQTKTLSIEFMPHMIRHVANAGPADLLASLLPHFQWMCVPRHNRVYPREEIAARLTAMFDADENHENLFFLKDPLPDWLRRRQAP